MARIPYFDPAEAEGELAELIARQPPLNIFRMLPYTGDLFKRFLQMGGHILGRMQLDPVLREIAIIRVGILSDASYEVHQHDRIGLDLGMSQELIDAVHDGPENPAFTEIQRLVMAFTDDVVRNVRAGDATFDPLLDQLGPQQVNELLLTIGFYMMVSRYLETLDIDIEDSSPNLDSLTAG